ncbi:MAG: twin-arginine translocase TatA/TatE family subunit [Lentisphaeria bacterium]|nr:twin-arginine translocase TatA/TatE family subunit [Lentisphaeria bacterium]
MFGLGHWEVILIFVLVLLLFGGKKLPEVAKGLGKAMREFRKARDELHDAVNQQPMDSDDAESGAGDDDGGTRP